MTSKSSKKALARNGDDPLCGFATAALKQVAADRLSGTNSRANIDVLPYFRSLVGTRDYDGPDQTMVALAEAKIAPETVLEILIPELATQIGGQWLSDDMSWSTVTIISSRLQTLAWRYIDPMMVEMSANSDAPSVLMVVPEGETHTLSGVLAVGTLIRNGVNVIGLFGEPDDRVFSIAGDGAFDTIGVSTSGVGGRDRLASLISGLQACAKDAALAIGGPISECNPQMVQQLLGSSHKVNNESLTALLPNQLNKGRKSALTV